MNPVIDEVPDTVDIRTFIRQDALQLKLEQGSHQETQKLNISAKYPQSAEKKFITKSDAKENPSRVAGHTCQLCSVAEADGVWLAFACERRTHRATPPPPAVTPDEVGRFHGAPRRCGCRLAVP